MVLLFALPGIRSGFAIEGLEGVAGGFYAVFPSDALGGGFSIERKAWRGEHGPESSCHTPGFVAGALDGSRYTETTHAAGIVGLVVGIRHDEHGLAGAQALGGGSYATLVHDDARRD